MPVLSAYARYLPSGEIAAAVTAFSEELVVSWRSFGSGTRACHFNMSHTTPIPNLWNVGDGVKRYADAGMEACSKLAKIVVEEITENHTPPGKQTNNPPLGAPAGGKR